MSINPVATLIGVALGILLVVLIRRKRGKKQNG